MNEEEFLKAHPGLKGKIGCSDEDYDWDYVRIPMEKGIGYVGIEDIHATQLDKQKVKEAIEKLGEKAPLIGFPAREFLKKELGID